MNQIKNIKSLLITSISSFTLGSVITYLYDDYVSIEQNKLSFREKKMINETCKFGLPSTEHIRVREGYVMSFNTRLKNPNWVYQRLTANQIDNQEAAATRKNKTFKEDKSISEIFRPKLSDYDQSGFDRGHLAPAADNKFSKVAMSDSFYLTNVSPQVGMGFNRNYWSRLEAFTRTLALSHSEIFIITGPLWIPETSPHNHHSSASSSSSSSSSASSSSASSSSSSSSLNSTVQFEMIGETQIAVPTHFFKVILAHNDNESKDKQFVIGGFIVPNKKISSNRSLESFAVKDIQIIEKLSGFELFPQIPKKVIQTATPLCVAHKCILPRQQFQSSKNDHYNQEE